MISLVVQSRQGGAPSSPINYSLSNSLNDPLDKASITYSTFYYPPCDLCAWSLAPTACVLQVKYNILATSPEKSGLLDKCQQLGVTLVAHSPLQQGILTGTCSHSQVWPQVHGSVCIDYWSCMHPECVLQVKSICAGCKLRSHHKSFLKRLTSQQSMLSGAVETAFDRFCQDPLRVISEEVLSCASFSVCPCACVR